VSQIERDTVHYPQSGYLGLVSRPLLRHYVRVVSTSPRPRRVTPPSWLDVRLVLGVALVIVAVVVGALVVARSHHTDPVVTVTRDLAAGTVLTRADLSISHVQLGDDAKALYASDADAVTGRRLRRDLAAGELVPIGVTVPARSLTTLSVPLGSGAAPALRAGQRIELWLSGPGCSSIILLPDVTVQAVHTDDSNFSGNGGQDVVISVAGDAADRVVVALALEDAHLRAGVLSGPGPAPGRLADVASCASSSATR
jgi:hypothetical protein